MGSPHNLKSKGTTVASPKRSRCFSHQEKTARRAAASENDVPTSGCFNPILIQKAMCAESRSEPDPPSSQRHFGHWLTSSIYRSGNVLDDWLWPADGASIHMTPQGGGYILFTDEGNLIRAELSPAGYREISRSHLIDPT